MTEEESLFDPTQKKKKKKKKAFDLDTALNDSESKIEDDGDDEGDKPVVEKVLRFDESTIGGDEKFEDLDLESFGKKKKKKKKTFDLDALEDALPEATKDEDAVPGDIGGDEGGEPKDDDFDLDMDFTKLKKKKMKKKKKDIDELMTGGEFGEDELGTPTESSAWGNTDRDYTYEELLARVFDIMREKNPDMVAGEKKKFVMKPPQVVRVGTKKVSFANFTEICRMLHRQQKHVLQFLLAELGTQGSVDGSNQLIIKGRFQQKQIENVLRRYIKEYVTCHTCRSPDTILQKDTRLFFLQCETCGSRCSVASIKSGYQAVTGKRSAQRAKNAYCSNTDRGFSSDRKRFGSFMDVKEYNCAFCTFVTRDKRIAQRHGAVHYRSLAEADQEDDIRLLDNTEDDVKSEEKVPILTCPDCQHVSWSTEEQLDHSRVCMKSPGNNSASESNQVEAAERISCHLCGLLLETQEELMGHLWQNHKSTAVSRGHSSKAVSRSPELRTFRKASPTYRGTPQNSLPALRPVGFGARAWSPEQRKFSRSRAEPGDVAGKRRKFKEVSCCDHCSYWSTSYQHFAVHYCSHSDSEWPWKCSRCPFVAMNVKDVQSHIQRVTHPIGTVAEKGYKLSNVAWKQFNNNRREILLPEEELMNLNVAVASDNEEGYFMDIRMCKCSNPPPKTCNLALSNGFHFHERSAAMEPRSRGSTPVFVQSEIVKLVKCPGCNTDGSVQALQKHVEETHRSSVPMNSFGMSVKSSAGSITSARSQTEQLSAVQLKHAGGPISLPLRTVPVGEVDPQPYVKEFEIDPNQTYPAFCGICNDVQDSYEALHAHLRNHKESGEYSNSGKLDGTSNVSKESQNQLVVQNLTNAGILVSRETTNFAPLHKCTMCTAGFTREEDLLDHKKLNHSEISLFNCKLCSFVTFSRVDSKRHAAQHARKVAETSQTSSPVNTVNEKVTVNASSEHSEDTGYATKRHVLSSSKKTVIYFACNSCPATFYREERILKHMKYHGVGHPLKCTYCNWSCVNKKHLTAHLRQHNDVRRIKSSRDSVLPAIDVDEEEEEDVQDADASVGIQSENPPKSSITHFECVICRDTFDSGPKLEHHMTSHGAGNRFSCKLCNFSTNAPKTMKKHKMVHERLESEKNEREKEESSMDEGLQSNEGSILEESVMEPGSSVVDEMLAKDPSEEESESLDESQAVLFGKKGTFSGEKLLYCPFCPESFRTEEKIEEHLTHHSDDSPFTNGREGCPHCDFVGLRAEISKHIPCHFNPSRVVKLECDISGMAIVFDPNSSRKRWNRSEEKISDPDDFTEETFGGPPLIFSYPFDKDLDEDPVVDVRSPTPESTKSCPIKKKRRTSGTMTNGILTRRRRQEMNSFGLSDFDDSFGANDSSSAGSVARNPSESGNDSDGFGRYDCNS
ncbi:unnamed protein product [Notodromas monacha]|uniref:Eukaryotic translation initiation factor 2 subunit 2 n=1 Tax=Notodromas monacha TaxID=399045 RepID=A0A7R9GFN7_9CRUS|nr:unnamed protein product [Notodromas monacha]CAG0919075.1 unnamed protein product [Notodromas monacha]